MELVNTDVDPNLIQQQYQPPLIPVTSVTNFGNVTIITTINGGGGGQATGPTLTIGSNWSGVNFVASGNSLNLDILNAANARGALNAAASGVNTDITQLNGASQVDVSGVYKVAGTQVVKAQQPAIPDADGTLPGDTTTINAILTMLRQHGLIST